MLLKNSEKRNKLVRFEAFSKGSVQVYSTEGKPKRLPAYTLFRKEYVWGNDLAGKSSFGKNSLGGVGGLVALKVHNTDGTSNSYSYISDNVGNIVALINAKGDIVNKYSYTPFGERTIIAEGVEQSFGFNTKLHDDTGLIYYNNRYYNAELGRFTSRDPIREEGGINIYSFVGNNPTNSWDILGFDQYIFLDPDGAKNRGHIAWGVDNPNGDGILYYSVNGYGAGNYDQAILYNSFDDFFSGIPTNTIPPQDVIYGTKNYDFYIKIETTSLQDETGLTYAENAVTLPYDLFDGLLTCGIGQNCGGFVDNIIHSWNPNLDPDDAILPTTWFYKLGGQLAAQDYCFEYGKNMNITETIEIDSDIVVEISYNVAEVIFEYDCDIDMIVFPIALSL